MKAQKIAMFVMGALALVLLVIVAENWGKLNGVNQRRHSNEAELSRLAEEIVQESKQWEEYHNGIGSMQNVYASYEAVFQKEDRAESLKASLEAVLESLAVVEAQQNAEKESLRAVWEALCDQMSIAYETEVYTEPDGDYDE